MRLAFRMKVHPGREAEYIERHNPIWPELEATLKQHSVRSYSIYLDRQSGDLFAYVEVDDFERWRAVAQSDVCRRWWQHMAALMPTHADNSPVVGELEEVFHIEAG